MFANSNLRRSSSEEGACVVLKPGSVLDERAACVVKSEVRVFLTRPK